MTVADVKSAVEHTPGGVDRRRIGKELEGNDKLIERYARITYREVNPGASDRALTAQAETAANRALKRGHSLERALWGTREHGQAGYYPPSSIEGHLTAAELEHFKKEILPKVLGGSDVIHGMTGNASLGVAARQKARGTPYDESLRAEGGDTYFDEDRHKTLPRLPGIPQGVTRLGAAPGTQPDAINAPSGSPAAFIVHHTAGRGTAADVVHGWENDPDPTRHGVGTQYIMDREGIIHDVAAEFGGTHKGHRGQGHFLNSVIPGVNNSTAVGMEIIAKNDADITPTQRANAIKFIQSQFPHTTPYGHSEVSPSDRTNEGVDIARTIRQLRAASGKSSSMSSDDYTKSKDYEGARGDDVRKRLQDINRTRRV
jgi:hypothetical protein